MKLNWGKIWRWSGSKPSVMRPWEYCTLPADLQETGNQGWALEHPDVAKSWHNDKVKAILGRGASVVPFDQCMFGSVSKVHCTHKREDPFHE